MIPGSTSFVLTAIGLVIVIGGVLIVSNAWKTPTYNLILAWDPEALPADWEAGRRRYFTINWIQLAVTWAAFALFLLALDLPLAAPAPRHGIRIPQVVALDEKRPSRAGTDRELPAKQPAWSAGFRMGKRFRQFGPRVPALPDHA